MGKENEEWEKMNTKFDLNDKVILKGKIDQITIDNDTNSKVVYIVSIHTGDSSYPNHIRIGENMLLKMQDCQKERRDDDTD